eukprot:TRINITY_DN30461_c0_g1_i1.p1 TRINITY_DN30461_c0_g1~~TRINITY_DN30461_c0_g1_i1.p1  ORF type:complete len:153 (+),score=28.74 TRINITY_DN30461_c0_g1_i1:56-514(+)
MTEESSGDDILTENDFQKMIKKLRVKKPEKYKFILKGRKSYQAALFCLYKKVWGSEVKPLSWEKSSSTILYKGKCSKNEFGNQRFIHSKDEIPKCFESLVTEKAKPKNVQKCSKFQIGGLLGHQEAEHLFTLKSIMSLFSSQGKPLILSCSI